MIAPLSGLVSSLGNYVLFMGKAVSTARSAVHLRREVFHQAVHLGFNALPVVMLASAFAGVVTTLQTAYQLQNTVLTEDAIGAIVVPTLLLELCALVPGLVMASRVGASIAAEIGTMRVSEQIDALEAMGLNSVSHLVLPRVLAGLLMFPAMYVASALVAVLAGGFAGEYMGFLSMDAFVRGARTYFLPFDAVYGMTKSLSFGFIITSIACWKGFNTRGGAQGVGIATTQAVVVSCVNILIADFIVAELLL